MRVSPLRRNSFSSVPFSKSNARTHIARSLHLAMKRTRSLESQLDGQDKSTKTRDEDLFMEMLNEAYRQPRSADGLARGVLVEPGLAKAVEVPPGMDGLRKTLGGVRVVQWLPATRGALKDKGYELWMDEEGRYTNAGVANKLATALLGEQAEGGVLYGNVLVCKLGATETEESDESYAEEEAGATHLG